MLVEAVEVAVLVVVLGVVVVVAVFAPAVVNPFASSA